MNSDQARSRNFIKHSHFDLYSSFLKLGVLSKMKSFTILDCKTCCTGLPWFIPFNDLYIPFAEPNPENYNYILLYIIYVTNSLVKTYPTHQHFSTARVIMSVVGKNL